MHINGIIIISSQFYIYIYIFFLKEKIIYPKNSFLSKKKNRRLNGKKFRKISLSSPKKRNSRKEE